MAGTVNQTVTNVINSEGIPGADEYQGESCNLKRLKFECICEAGAATIPDTATNTANTLAIQGMFFICLYIEPGTPNPSADCDVYIKDEFGLDLLGGNGVDALDATGNKMLNPLINSLGGSPPIIGAITLDVDGNAVNAAEWNIYCIFSKYPMAVAGLT